MNEVPKCGCGRSPIENCIGWHALSEEEYIKKKGTIKIATKKCLQRFINTSIYKLTMINLIPKKNKTILAK